MRHLLLGYGYCAEYLSQELLANGLEVLAYSRSKQQPVPQGLVHYCLDLGSEKIHQTKDDCLYYFIPPSDPEDSLLKQILNNLAYPPQKIIYCGSSAVYGNHQGEWVDESSPCHIQNLRQKQRQIAEQHIQDYAKQYHIPSIICRLAGIYGPGRLPLDAVKEQTPVVHPNQAPLINHIFIKDLSYILKMLAENQEFQGIINIADGHPIPMGQLQQKLASKLGYPLAAEINCDLAYQQASPMRREFLSQSKQLNINLLKNLLQPFDYHLTKVDEGLETSLASM
jgi:nucleoside-diphosphate-sugar epimerase